MRAGQVEYGLRIIADCGRFAETKSLFLKAILLAYALSGCATSGPPQPPAADLGSIDFVLSGKLAVRDSQRGVSLRLRWQHSTAGYDIEVWGPLGQGRTQLRGDDRLMRVTRGDKLLAQGPPETVMREQLGWVVPVRFLSSWIRGEPYHPADGPDPASRVLRLSAAQLDAMGRFVSFEQADWQVQLSGYRAWPKQSGDDSAPASATTPRRIIARKDTSKVTLVVSEFHQ